MAFDIPVAASRPVWIRDTAFPRQDTSILGNGNIGNSAAPVYDKDVGEDPVNLTFLSLVTAGTGSLTGQYLLHNTLPGIKCTPSGAFGSGYFWGDNLPIDINFDSRLEFGGNAEQSRVWVDELYLARDNAPNDSQSELSYYPVSGAVQPTVAAQDWRASLTGRYGIRGNVAGTGIEWFSTDGVAITEAVTLAWPASTLDQWVKVQVVHIDATSQADASVSLFLNNALVLTRLWGVGSNLPSYADSVSADPMHVRRIFRASQLAGPTWYAARLRCRAGIFDQAGVSLQG